MVLRFLVELEHLYLLCIETQTNSARFSLDAGEKLLGFGLDSSVTRARYHLRNQCQLLLLVCVFYSLWILHSLLCLAWLEKKKKKKNSKQSINLHLLLSFVSFEYILNLVNASTWVVHQYMTFLHLLVVGVIHPAKRN